MIKTKRDAEIVAELRRLVAYESAAFGYIGGSPADDPLPKTEKEVTDFIRRRTRLYVGSWILPLLEKLEGKKS